MKRIVFWMLCVILLAEFPVPGQAEAKYIQIEGVTDVTTRFSEGCFTVQEVAAMAQNQGLDAVIFGDRARNSLQYGVFPFPRLLKKTITGPSVLASGAQAFISEIHSLDRQFRETLLIPGVSVAPFYYWTGRVLDDTLVAHNWNKRLLVLGLPDAGSYEQLPILNSNFSRRYASRFQNAALGFGFLFLAFLTLVYKKFYRWITVPLMVLFFLLTLNHHPFRSSPFDPYHGDQGIAPYQEVIDFVNSQGGLVFWDNLGNPKGRKKRGSVQLETHAHPQDLVVSQGVFGFQAVAQDPVPATDPGREWDQALMQYLRGQRSRPVWGYGGNDYTCENQEDPMFGAIRTVFLVREKTTPAILEALRTGRLYGVRHPGSGRLSLDEFLVRDPQTGHTATLGEELLSTDSPELQLKVRSLQKKKKTARIEIIRNGELLKQETVTLPYELHWKDVQAPREGRLYYRVRASVGPADHLVSNPVFVRFPGSRETVASLAQENREATLVRRPTPPERTEPETPDMKSGAPRVASPGEPGAASAPTASPEPSPPQKAASPAPPRVSGPPSPSPAAPPKTATGPRFAIPRIDGVTLKKGPGASFPEAGKAQKGEKLEIVRRTDVLFNGKPWWVVRRNGSQAYVWDGLVNIE